MADSESFKSKVIITGNAPADSNTKNVILLLKYLGSFWRTFEMLFINWKVNVILTWSSNCVITKFADAGRFTINDTKLYVPIVTLSTQDNIKLIQQLKSFKGTIKSFKRTIYWNKYQSYPKTYAQKQNLNHLVDPRFQGMKGIFVLSFENKSERSHSNYYLSKVEIKDYNVMIDGNFFGQQTNNDFKAYEIIRKIAVGQGDDYTTACLLYHPYFKENYKMTPTDLSKEQA